MAGLRSAVVDPEQERIDAQLAYANALRDMGSKGSTGAAVGGYQGGPVYMVGNPWQGAINQVGGIALGALGDYKAKQLEALRRKEMSDWVGGMPGNTTTQPDFSPQQIKDIPSPMLTKQVPRLGTREVPKTWQQQAVDMQNWGKQGLTMDNPQAQQVAMEAIQSAVQTPEKMQQLEAQNELKKAMLAAQYGYKGDLEQLKGGIRSGLQGEQNDYRMGQIGLQQGGANYRNDTNANVKTALTLAGFENATTRDAAKAKAAITLKRTPSAADIAKAASSNVPPAILKAGIENQITTDMLENVKKTVKANPDAFGLKAFVPDAALQRIDPKGVSARATLATLRNAQIKTTSGTAVSASEQQRLAAQLPNDTDTAETINKKLNVFDTMLKERGYRLEQADPHGGNTPPPARTPPAKPADMSDAEYAEFLSDKGYK